MWLYSPGHTEITVPDALDDGPFHSSARGISLLKHVRRWLLPGRLPGFVLHLRVLFQIGM